MSNVTDRSSHAERTDRRTIGVTATRWGAAACAAVLLGVSGCASPGQATESAPGQSGSATPNPAAASSRILTFGGNDKVPGCAAAVGHDGEVVWADQVGLTSTTGGQAITDTTLLDIASVSKQFTAAAVLNLVLEGKVSQEDHLDRYFPNLPGWAKEVTIFQLIHHQSGIPDYEKLFLDAGVTYADVTTQAQAIDAISKVQALNFPPGSDFAYSNSNYILLADIVAIVSGEQFPQYVTNTIFEPLGLEMTVDPGPNVPNKATSYSYKDNQYVDATSGWLQVGDGSIQTTPSELVKWADNYRTGKFGGQELLKLQLENAVPVGNKLPGDVTVYGAGIWEQGNGRLAHDGGWEGFDTMFVISRDRHHAVAVTCNHYPTSADVPFFAQTIAETILDEWAGPDL